MELVQEVGRVQEVERVPGLMVEGEEVMEVKQILLHRHTQYSLFPQLLPV